MAKNKITWEWGDNDSIIFTGSQRMPTLAEINNFCLKDPNLHWREGCWITSLNLGNGYLPEESCTSVTLYEWGPERCPVCGHEYEIADRCPICNRRFDEE